MDPMLEEYRKVAESIKYKKVKNGLTFISGVDGKVVEMLDAEYWVRHTREAVRFTEAMKHLNPCNIFLEVGPHPVLSALLSSNLSANPTCFPSMRKQRKLDGGDFSTILDTLGKLWIRGVAIKWKEFHCFQNKKKISLPFYPFQRKRFWFPMSAEILSTNNLLHPILGSKLDIPSISSASDKNHFSNNLSLSSLPYLKDHKVGNFLILPGAAFIEMGLAAIKEENNYPISIEKFTIKSPLLLDENEINELYTICEDENISIFAKHHINKEWKLHAELQKGKANESIANNLQKQNVTEDSEPFHIEYDELKKFGYNFGPAFESLSKVSGLGTSFVFGEICLREGVIDPSGRDIVNTVLIDAMIQLYLLAHQPKLDSLTLPLAINSFKLFSPLPSESQFIIEVNLDFKHAVLYSSKNDNPIAILEGLDFVKTSLAAVEKSLSGKEALPSMLKDQYFPCPGVGYTECPKFLSQEVNVKALIQAFQENSTDHPNDEQAFGNFYSAISLGILKTFLELGAAQLEIGVDFTLQDFIKALKIVPEHILPVRRFIKLCCDYSYFKQVSEDTFQIPSKLPTIPKLEEEFVKFQDDSLLKIEIEHIAVKLQKKLAAILKGELNVLSVFFPSETGSLSDDFSAANIYKYSQYMLRSHFVLEILLEKFMQTRSSLNILEVGSGTGSTTPFVLNAIKKCGNIKYHYSFTDISPAFFPKARERFPQNLEHFSFKVLDIEQDPKEMGFGPFQYDLIIGANVLHVTRDLKKTCTNLRHLLKPKGMLAIVELFEPTPLFDNSFALMPGFWQFEDKDLRPDYPIISVKKWKKLLLDGMGFSDVHSFPTCLAATGVILAEASDCYETFQPNLPKVKNIWSIVGPWKAQNQIISSNLMNMGKGVNFLIQSTPKPDTTEGIIFAIDNYKETSFNFPQITTASYKIIENFLSFLQKVLEAFDGKQLPKLFLITSGLCTLPEDDEKLAPPVESPLSAIFKCFLFENDAKGRHIDLDPNQSPEATLPTILSELFKEDTEFLVRYRQGIRFKRRLVSGMPSLHPKYLPLPLPASGKYELVLSKTNAITDLKFAPISSPQDLVGSELEIQILAVAHNFKDLYCVMKPSDFFAELNSVAADWAGVVVRVGPDSDGRVRVGDRVCGLLHNQPVRSHIVAQHSGQVARIPDDVLYQHAATLPTAFLTIYYFLIKDAKLRKGQTLLVHGATGGVGLLALQLAKHIGAEVIATAGSNRKRRYLREILGIRHIFSSRTLAFSEGVLKSTNGKGVDVVLNFLTGPGFKEASLKALGSKGIFLEMAVLNVWTENEVRDLRPDVTYYHRDLGKVFEIDDVLTALEGMLAKGQIHPLPYTEFSIGNIRNSLSYFEKAAHIGKVVLKLPSEPGEDPKLFNDSGVYLITGGCGGIGFEVGKWMLKNGAKNLILMGRNKAGEKQQEEIDHFNDTDGKNIQVFQGDISNFETVGELISQISQSQNKLCGIIHCAGCLSDAIIQNQTMSTFDHVLQSKLKGTWNLHFHTKNLHLEHFALFSSGVTLIGISGNNTWSQKQQFDHSKKYFVGNSGQSNYAAANTFLDSFAHYRHSLGLVATTFNWGQWSEVGVVAGKDIMLALPIPTIECLNALDLTLRSPSTIQIAPLEINFPILELVVPWAKPYFELCRKSEKSGPHNMKDESRGLGSPDLFKEEYDAACNNDAERSSIILKHISYILSYLLRLDKEEFLEPGTAFEELGLDSLMYIEFRNGLQRMLLHTGVAISASDVSDCNNLEDVANKIKSILNSTTTSKSKDTGISPELRQLIVNDSKLWEGTSTALLAFADQSTSSVSNVSTVFVTGATGTLGRYMVAELSKLDNIRKIVCLVRGTAERLKIILEQFGIDQRKVSVIVGDLNKTKFGIGDLDYEILAKEVDAIVHCAAYMGFLQPYSKNSQVRMVTVIGTQKILEFASTQKVKWLFHASTIISTGLGRNVNSSSNVLQASEEYPNDSDLDFSQNFGYGISKFVADRLVSEAAKLGLPTKAFRFPTISGESSKRKFNMGWSYYLRKVINTLQTGQFLPTPFPMGSMPVDLCAKLSLEIFFNSSAPLGFYHMSNPKPIPEIEILQLVPEFGPIFKFAGIVAKLLRSKQVESNNFFQLLSSDCLSQGLDLSQIKHLIPEKSNAKEFTNLLKNEEFLSFLRTQESFVPKGKTVSYPEFMEKLENLGEASILYPWTQMYRDGKSYYVNEEENGNMELEEMYEKFTKDFHSFFENKLGKVFQVLPDFKEMVPDPMEIARRDLNRALGQVLFWGS